MRHTRLSFPRVYFLLVLALLALQVLFWMSPSHEEKIRLAYLWPLGIALVLVALGRRENKAMPGRGVTLAMVCWLWLANALNGDIYLIYNHKYLTGILLTFGVCYPTFLLVHGQERTKLLRIFAMVTAGALTCVALLGLYVTLFNTSIPSPFSNSAIQLLDNRLHVFDLHPNEVACMLTSGLFLALYLLASAKGWPGRLLWALVTLCLYACIPITVSRTVMVTASIGMGLLALLFTLRASQGRKMALRMGVGLVALAVAAALSFMLFTGTMKGISLLAERINRNTQSAMSYSAQEAETTEEPPVAAPDEEALVRNLANFNSRTEIWEAGLKAIQDRPITLLIGMSDAQVARIPTRALPRDIYHMHNSWLEILLLGGIPGLCLYLLFVLRLVLSAVKLFFKQEAPLAWRILAILPAVLLVNGLTEIYPAVAGKAMDMLFYLVAGAVIGLASQEGPPQTETLAAAAREKAQAA